MNSGVYQLRCTVTGAKYIGSSAALKTRRTAHLSQIRGHRHPVKALQALADANGADSIVFEVLEHCEPASNFVRELHWIKAEQPSLNTQVEKVGGSRPLNREKLEISMPRSIAKALLESATARGYSRTRLIEELVREYLDRPVAPPKGRRPRKP